MNDADLKALYRRMTRDLRADFDADTVAEPLARSGYPDVEATPLDRVATSAAHADLLRVAQSLSSDAAALSREVAALRAPRRVGMARGWLALAAGVGSAAILIAALRPDHASMPVAVEAPAAAESGEIFSMSFESAVSDPAVEGDELDEAAPIFNADFDS